MAQEAAWLVECPKYHPGKYFALCDCGCGRHHWTKDVHKATKFATKQEAETTRGGDTNCVAIEHLFGLAMTLQDKTVDRDAKLTLKLRAGSGYCCDQTAQISLAQWDAITRIIEGAPVEDEGVVVMRKPVQEAVWFLRAQGGHEFATALADAFNAAMRSTPVAEHDAPKTIERLRRALVRYGDRVCMATSSRPDLQQEIDDAFAWVAANPEPAMRSTPEGGE